MNNFRNLLQILSKKAFLTNQPCNFTAVRNSGYERWRASYYRELKKRRDLAGPEPLRHRNVWPNWNYNSELYAFARRLKEDFKEDTLRTALTHKSYLEAEAAKRASLGIDEKDVPLLLNNNEELSKQGIHFISKYVKGFLRYSYPYFPEEGICAVHDFLLSHDMLAYIGSNIGLKDIILCGEFPPMTSTMSLTLQAVIGALAADQGQKRAEVFVLDFILTQLIGRDVNHLWTIVNPMGVLTNILERSKKGLPEPRLLRQTGSATVMAVYFVGLYSDKKLLGKSPGETLIIAEEMAARDALRQLFRTTDDIQPLKFGKDAYQVDFSGWMDKPKLYVSEWCDANVSKNQISIIQ